MIAKTIALAAGVAGLTVAAAASGMLYDGRTMLKSVAPTFPDAGHYAGKPVQAQVSFDIGADGHVSACRVQKEVPTGNGFGSEACKAVLQYEFSQVAGADGEPRTSPGQILWLTYVLEDQPGAGAH